MVGHPLEALTDLPGVTEAVARARRACEELRWHRALRRQWAVVRTEVGIRCARAGAEIDGVRLPLDLVRDLARGAAPPSTGPDGAVVLGALRVQSEVERLMAAPGASRPVGTVPFGQLLARLHAVGDGGATTPSDRSPVGRPRTSEQPADLRGLGPAPTGAELSERLEALARLVATPLPAQVPALVLAAVVHGELLVLRPFAYGNGAVARGLLRHQLTTGGVDPVGVVAPEVHLASEPQVYLSSAARYAAGGPDGVAGWLRYCAEAVVRGAGEGTVVADAVLAGRLAG